MKLRQFYEWVEHPEFSMLWDKYVPAQGEADTLKGEAIRAIGRLEYDYYNNGYGNVWDQNYRTGGWVLSPMFKKLIKSLRDYLRQEGGPVQATRILSKAKPAYLVQRHNGKYDPTNFAVRERKRRQDAEFEKSIKTLKDWFTHEHLSDAEYDELYHQKNET